MLEIDTRHTHPTNSYLKEDENRVWPVKNMSCVSESVVLFSVLCEPFCLVAWQVALTPCCYRLQRMLL